MSDTTEGIERALVAWEGAARAAVAFTDAKTGEALPWLTGLGGRVFDAGAAPIAQAIDEATAEHLVRNDPAAVLRMVAGIRAVVALHVPAASDARFCAICGDPYFWDQTPPEPWPCPTLQALAAMFAPAAEAAPERITSCSETHDGSASREASNPPTSGAGRSPSKSEGPDLTRSATPSSSASTTSPTSGPCSTGSSRNSTRLSTPDPALAPAAEGDAGVGS